jgi:hypothetical protein
MGFEDSISRRTFRAFARQATYSLPIGDPVSVRVIVDRAVERWGGTVGAAVIAPVDEASFLRSEIVPERNAVLTMGGDSWRIGDVIADDGYIVNVALRKIND